MITIKKTKKELKKLLRYLKDKVIEMEDDFKKTGIGRKIKAMKEWETMEPEDRAKIRYAWSKYYKAVTKTRAYAIFTEQAEAASHHDLTRVKELAEEARVIRDSGKAEVKQPEFMDPTIFSLDSGIISYKKMLKDIKNIEYELDSDNREAKADKDELFQSGEVKPWVQPPY